MGYPPKVVTNDDILQVIKKYDSPLWLGREAEIFVSMGLELLQHRKINTELDYGKPDALDGLPEYGYSLSE